MAASTDYALVPVAALVPGDVVDDGYPNGLVTVREVANDGEMVGILYGIRDNDVQGTIHYLSDETAKVLLPRPARIDGAAMGAS